MVEKITVFNAFGILGILLYFYSKWLLKYSASEVPDLHLTRDNLRIYVEVDNGGKKTVRADSKKMSSKVARWSESG